MSPPTGGLACVRPRSVSPTMVPRGPFMSLGVAAHRQALHPFLRAEPHVARHRWRYDAGVRTTYWTGSVLSRPWASDRTCRALRAVTVVHGAKAGPAGGMAYVRGCRLGWLRGRRLGVLWECSGAGLVKRARSSIDCSFVHVAAPLVGMEPEEVGRSRSQSVVFNQLLDHHENQQLLTDAALQSAFQDGSGTDVNFANPDTVGSPMRPHRDDCDTLSAVPVSQTSPWSIVGANRSGSVRVAVQLLSVQADRARITQAQLEKVAESIGRNQRIQPHGALLLIEPTQLVRHRLPTPLDTLTLTQAPQAGGS